MHNSNTLHAQQNDVLDFLFSVRELTLGSVSTLPSFVKMTELRLYRHPCKTTLAHEIHLLLHIFHCLSLECNHIESAQVRELGG